MIFIFEKDLKNYWPIGQFAVLQKRTSFEFVTDKKKGSKGLE